MKKSHSQWFIKALWLLYSSELSLLIFSLSLFCQIWSCKHFSCRCQGHLLYFTHFAFENFGSFLSYYWEKSHCAGIYLLPLYFRFVSGLAKGYDQCEVALSSEQVPLAGPPKLSCPRAFGRDSIWLVETWCLLQMIQAFIATITNVLARLGTSGWTAGMSCYLERLNCLHLHYFHFPALNYWWSLTLRILLPTSVLAICQIFAFFIFWRP